MKKNLFASLMLLAMGSTAFAENYWMRSFPNESCSHICQRSNKQAVEAGVHGSGGRFFTCMAADGRPGYQLINHSNKCGVGINYKEIGYDNFYCLCTDGSGQTPIVN